MKSLWTSIGCAALAVALAGCAHAPPNFPPIAAAPVTGIVTNFAGTNTLDPAWLKPPPEPFTLGPGDRVEIQLVGETPTKVTTIVAPDGKIYFDLLPGLDVWGLTLSQAKALLETNYSQYVREPPKVSIILREVNSQHVWVLGRVQAPGVYPMTGPMTVLEAISLAGGTMSLTSYRDQEAAGVGEELADLKRSFVVRQGKCLPVNFEKLLLEGDMSQNIYLEPDDFIYFPSAASRDVYVLGAVEEPRLVPYHEGMTVAGAVAGAYGTLKEAYLTHVGVVRGSLAQPRLAVVNLKRILHGGAADMPLEPGDIVYVPVSPYSYIDHYLEVILDTFVSSAAINAGSSLVGVPSTGTPGVFIPVGSGVQIIPPASPPPIH
ncbi:MAG TPA: polysaccharide biosynthesis/export family protein [Verrucomicrobiae bacterium]|jgi:protein involved in polysaccharide export with SLBB domain